MTVDSIQIGKTTEDVLLILQKTSHSVGQLAAYNRDALTTGVGKVIHTCSDYPRLVRSTNDASVVVVAAKDTVHVGYLKSKAKANHTIADREYQFFSFGVGDLITSIDICCQSPGKKQQSQVDLAVGCARGPILLYHDVVSRSPLATSSTPRKGGSVQPRKHHWHRRAVHSVKWSHDGKCPILRNQRKQCANMVKATI
jgi:NET1-associated nuclear protein 1 (U3 small nucleolar RNA-associated protein 17)